MKKLITLVLFALSLVAFAQPDTTPIIVNVRNSAKLEWNNSAVKMKFRVLQVRFVSNGQKDFYFHGYLEMYENVGGAYGSKITDLIAADGTLSNEEKQDLLSRYGDREIQYNTVGKYVDGSGNRVVADSLGVYPVGSKPELEYWQSFKLNNAGLGLSSASTQGALDAVYKIIIAIVNKLDSRKNI